MIHSSVYVGIPPPPAEHFSACALAAVAANAEFVPPHGSTAALYVRPVIFGLGGGSLALAPPDDYLFCVFVSPINPYLGGGAGPLKALVVDEFDRAAPRGTGSAKVGGNYAPVMPWSERAKKEGFGLTLHLDSRDSETIDEFGSSGFIGIEKVGEEGEGRYRMVIPDSKSAVKSVTSDSCLQLGKKLGWEVEVRKVSLTIVSHFVLCLQACISRLQFRKQRISLRSLLLALPSGSSQHALLHADLQMMCSSITKMVKLANCV